MAVGMYISRLEALQYSCERVVKDPVGHHLERRLGLVVRDHVARLVDDHVRKVAGSLAVAACRADHTRGFAVLVHAPGNEGGVGVLLL